MTLKPKVLEIIFTHKQYKDNGDIIDLNVERVEKTEQYPEGIRYSLVYIHHGMEILKYDNQAGHTHHKHVKGKRMSYYFTDEWKLLEDFDEELKELGFEL